MSENNTTTTKPDAAQQHNGEHQYMRQKIVEFDNELTFLAGKLDRIERDYLLYKEQIYVLLNQIMTEIRSEGGEPDAKSE